MKTSDYLVDFLIAKDITDVFGIPGGVVLSFLDSIAKRSSDIITAHLNYNEQASALSACGYAQASGKPAVAYATRGPGITNMITGIADAFRDSLPILFITAHSHSHKGALSGTDIRFEENQEFDTAKTLSSFTKYAVNIERIEDVRYELEKAYHLAVNGRPGPVLIDFLTSVLNGEITPESERSFIVDDELTSSVSSDNETIINSINNALAESKRPILLIGDGIRLSDTVNHLETIANKWNIPILSSRFSQDLIPTSANYYGYIGSHGTRYANFILSKCDLIISLGNRMAFNPNSKSFGVITNNAKIIRIDVDKNEFLRKIPNTECFVGDLKDIMPALSNSNIEWNDADADTAGRRGWNSVCHELKESLYAHDTGFPVNAVSTIIKNAPPQTVITSDVGNNELCLSRAYAFSGASNRLLFSKSFGTLGCSLPKAVGAFYSTRNRVLCFTGDQGLQMNMQELQLIAKENLPISIIVLNNFASGMIRDDQARRFGSRFSCTTADSGYGVPDLKKLAEAFGINYICFDGNINESALTPIVNNCGPILVDILLKDDSYRLPYLPVGYAMQNFVPEIDKELYERLERL